MKMTKSGLEQLESRLLKDLESVRHVLNLMNGKQVVIRTSDGVRKESVIAVLRDSNPLTTSQIVAEIKDDYPHLSPAQMFANVTRILCASKREGEIGSHGKSRKLGFEWYLLKQQDATAVNK